MKNLTSHISKAFSTALSLPEAARNALMTKITESFVDRITDEIIATLEDEGFDVNLTINLHIKKH